MIRQKPGGVGGAFLALLLLEDRTTTTIFDEPNFRLHRPPVFLRMEYVRTT